MKKFILLLLLITAWNKSYSQAVIQTYTDRCTNVVYTFTVPFNGQTVVAFYNRSQVFTAADFTNGTLQAWLEETYLWWSTLNPCSAAQAETTTAQQTAQQTTQAATQAATNAAAAAPPPPATTTTSPPPATGTTNTSTTNTTGSTSSGSTGGSTTNTTGSTGGDGSGSSSSGSTGGGDGSGSSSSGSTGSGSSGGDGDGGSTGGGDTGSGDGSGSSGGDGDGSSGGGDGSSDGGDGDGSSGGEGEGGGEEKKEETKTEEENKEETKEESKEEEKKEEESKEEEKKEEESEEESEESSEEKEEEKKEEDKKKEKKKNLAPPILAANVMSMQMLDGTWSTAASFGLSQSSLTGQETYSANAMIWTNFQQFSLGLSKSKVHFWSEYEGIDYVISPETGKRTIPKDPITGIRPKDRQNQIHHVGATSVNYMYLFGTNVVTAGYSHVILGQEDNFWKGFAGGYAAMGSLIVLPESLLLSPSLTFFGTKPVAFKSLPRWGFGPMVAVSLSPVQVNKQKNDINVVWNEYFTYIIGTNVNFNLTQRFVANLGINTINNTNPLIPTTFAITIGARFAF